MMVIGKHRKDLFADEEGRLAVRQLFCRLRKCRTDSSYPFYMLRALVGLLPFCSLFQVVSSKPEVERLALIE
jgi:hypothetical protein